ncbi:type VI lipase adapter Tla3 domain-containing protein, partial [Burkholderia sp. IMCC1007]|uniref:type VI lipase adapter Tla3 domain-containing protein n=1 Tax=Burkholderia sp. IMCC1007 TaxID=3004104 RepID=UPI0022B53DD7
MKRIRIALSGLAMWMSVSMPAMAAPTDDDPLSRLACPLSNIELIRTLPPTPNDLPAAGTSMSASKQTAANAPKLTTLDIVRVGLSLDVYRQGQAWARLQQQNALQNNSLHVGTALPMDPKDYPTNADDKDMAWEQRMANALELALQGFPERWPIPTVSVVRSYNPKAQNLRTPADMVATSLNRMANT